MPKAQKGEKLEQIAEELEEDADIIKPIIGIAGGFAPDYDEEAVIMAVRRKTLSL